jgi:hypothetical protein
MRLPWAVPVHQVTEITAAPIFSENNLLILVGMLLFLCLLARIVVTILIRNNPGLTSLITE